MRYVLGIDGAGARGSLIVDLGCAARGSSFVVYCKAEAADGGSRPRIAFIPLSPDEHLPPYAREQDFVQLKLPLASLRLDDWNRLRGGTLTVIVFDTDGVQLSDPVLLPVNALVMVEHGPRSSAGTGVSTVKKKEATANPSKQNLLTSVAAAFKR